jgi:hypothetical protein
MAGPGWSFGTIFFAGTSSGYDSATESATRMRLALWVCLSNMFLWFLTTVLGVGWYIRDDAFVGLMESPASSGGFFGVVERGMRRIHADHSIGCVFGLIVRSCMKKESPDTKSNRNLSEAI